MNPQASMGRTDVAPRCAVRLLVQSLHTPLRWQRTVTAALAPLDVTHVQFVLLACIWWLNRVDEDPNQLAVARQAARAARRE